MSEQSRLKFAKCGTSPAHSVVSRDPRAMDEKGDDVLDGREIRYKIKRGFKSFELVHQVEITDVATGIQVKSGKFLSVDTSWRKAKELYTSTLIAAGKHKL